MDIMKPNEPNNSMNTINPKNPKTCNVLMLLTNAFDPDPRVHQEAVSLVNAGYDVTILGWDRDLKAVPKEMIDGIQVERIYVRSTHGRGSSQMLFLLYFWVKAFVNSFSKDFQVVHCHDFDTRPLGFFLSRLKRSKLVYDAHESYIDMLINIPNLLKKVIFLAESILMKRSDLVITVGEILREYLMKRGAQNTCIVGNWQDPKKFCFDSKKLHKERNSLGISYEQLVIVFIAHLGTERQLPQLIDAVKQIPEAYLILGGNGPCKDLAENADKNFPNIKYLGYVKPSKIPLYTALSDVVFYGFDPNVPNATFSAPNKLFEGLAAGKVILTGNFGEIAKIVRETNCGVILEEYSVESIRAAISHMNSDHIRMFGENAKEAGLSLYNWGRAKQTLLEHYEGLCS